VGVEPKLERSGGGIFDVIVDGRILFSKHVEGRFPQEQEVLDKLPDPEND
jgi:hypothetical protein